MLLVLVLTHLMTVLIVKLKLWGCRRWFLVLMVPALVPVGLWRETTVKVCCDMMCAHEQCGFMEWRFFFLTIQARPFLHSLKSLHPCLGF